MTRHHPLQALISSITSACVAHLSNVSGSNSRDACLVHILPHMPQSDHTAIKVIATASSTFHFSHHFSHHNFVQSPTGASLRCDRWALLSILTLHSYVITFHFDDVTFHNIHPADSLDYNGHSTVAETLFMGLPCVTQPGDLTLDTFFDDVRQSTMTSVTSGVSMASRVAASLLLLGSRVSVGVVFACHTHITRDVSNIGRYSSLVRLCLVNTRRFLL